MKLASSAKKQLQKILGPVGVLTDELSLALYAYDCSVSRARPDGVLLVNSSEQVPQILRVLHQYQIPFVPRGSATNHAGSCAALKGGVILNLTALNHILEINTEAQFARVEPGVITSDLQEKLAPLGFFYAPDPASQQVCTIGGNVAQNASGARCLKYGGTLEHVLEATFVLPNGKEIVISRQDPGPDLVGLLCGSEGTLGVLTQLKLRILPLAKHVQTFLVTFPSLQDSVQTVSDLTARGIIPRCVEAMDQITIQSVEGFAHAGYPTDAKALLILELEGAPAQIKKDAKLLEKICCTHHAQEIRPAASTEERQALWRGRQSAFAAMARLSPNVIVGDGTVPRSRLPHALARVQEILKQNNLQAGLLFHAGDGNFHPHLLFDERNKLQTAQVARVQREILKVCVDEQGTLSGEHGIGVEKRALMTYAYDVPTLTAMARIKQTFDPQNVANPLKILPHNFAQRARASDPLSPQIHTLQETMVSYQKNHTPFVICGNNTQLKATKGALISARALQEIVEIDTANYTVTAQAGVLLNELTQVLLKAGVYSVLPTCTGTLGGAFCSGQFPEFYAHVTGIEALLPDGSYVRYGGKLMKNSAGYHLTRLLAGSQGTLGLVTQLTFKVFAQPVKMLSPRICPTGINPLWQALRETFDPGNLVLNHREQTTP